MSSCHALALLIALDISTLDESSLKWAGWEYVFEWLVLGFRVAMHVDSKFMISLSPKITCDQQNLFYYASHSTINNACLRVTARPYGKPEFSPLGAGLLSERWLLVPGFSGDPIGVAGAALALTSWLNLHAFPNLQDPDSANSLHGAFSLPGENDVFS